MTAERLAICLLESAAVGFVVLGCGAVAVKLCRQPVKRISLIQWILVVVVATPLLLSLPLATRWSLAILPPVSAAEGQSTSLLSEAEERAVVPLGVDNTGGADETGGFESRPQPVAFARVENTAKPLTRSYALPAWQLTIVTLHGLAACVLLARLGIGFTARRRLYHSSSPASPAAAALLDEISGERGRRARLRTSRRVQSPVTWGLWRPVIVLPSSWLNKKTDAELQFALAHEWSHIERRDIASCYLALAAEILCFYQPVFWWLRQKLALCQDHIADARAAALAAAPEDYADFLLSVARQRRGRPIPGALSISSRRSHLFRRISMLCSPGSIAHSSSFRWNMTAAAVALLAIAAVTKIRLQPISAADPPASTPGGEAVPGPTASGDGLEKPGSDKEDAVSQRASETDEEKRGASSTNESDSSDDTEDRGAAPFSNPLSRRSTLKLLNEVRAAHAANFDQIDTLALSCITRLKFTSENSETTGKQLVLWKPTQSLFLATDITSNDQRGVRRQPITLDLLFGRSVDAKIFSMKYPESMMQRVSVYESESTKNTYRISTHFDNGIGPKLYVDWHVRQDNGYYPHYVLVKTGETAKESRLTEEAKFSYTKKGGRTIPELAIVSSYDDLGKLSHSVRIFVTRSSLSAIDHDDPIEVPADLSEERLFGSTAEESDSHLPVE